MNVLVFQEDKLKEAAAAAYTYYITNQDDKRVIENLQYYRSQAGVTEEDFVDLERRPHQVIHSGFPQLFYACWVIFHDFRCFFSKLTFSKNSFRNSISVSNNLDPDQALHSFCPAWSRYNLFADVIGR